MSQWYDDGYRLGHQEKVVMRIEYNLIYEWSSGVVASFLWVVAGHHPPCALATPRTSRNATS